MPIYRPVRRATESSTFKVSIWTPFVPQTALLKSATVAASGSDPPTVSELIEDSTDLQKEAFSWRMLEDAFAGIINLLERERLTKLLSETMATDIHPHHRSVASLRAFVDDAKRVLASGGVEWSGSQSPPSEDDEALRLNTLLALVNHLSWLIAVFEDQPNVSVTIR